MVRSTKVELGDNDARVGVCEDAYLYAVVRCVV